MMNRPAPIRILRGDVTLLVTNRCANSCRHCIPQSGSALKDELDAQEWVRCLTRLRARCDATGLAISGGEPFLKPGFVRIYEAAAAMFQVSLFSSGFGFTKTLRAVLARHPPARFIASLYGLPAAHDAFCGRAGAFADVKRCLEFFREAGSRTVVNVICHRGNLADVPKIIECVRERGLAQGVKLLAFSPVGRGKGLLPSSVGSARWLAFAERLRREALAGYAGFGRGMEVERHVAALGGGERRPFGCAVAEDGGGVFSSCVHIDANGDMYPCVMLLRDPVFRLGNVMDPRRLDLAGYRRRVKAAVAAVRKRNCAGCATADSCSKGCLGYHRALGRDHRCAGRAHDLGCPTRYEALLG